MANTLRSLSSAPCVPKPGRVLHIRTAGLVVHHRAPGLHFPEADVEITAKTARFVERPRRRKLPIPPNYSLDPNIPPLPSQDLETQKTPSSFSSHAHTSTALRTSSTPSIKLFSNAQPANIDYRSPSPGPRKQLLTHATGNNRALNPQAWIDIRHLHSPPAPGHVRTPTSHARHPRIGSARSRCRTPGRIGSDAQCVFLFYTRRRSAREKIEDACGGPGWGSVGAAMVDVAGAFWPGRFSGSLRQRS